MLYLRLFFEIIHKNPVKGGAYLGLTLMLLFSSLGQRSIEKNLKKIVKVNSGGPYFYALLNSSENHNRVGRKLKALPGVSGVYFLPKSKVESKIKEIVGSLGVKDVAEELFDVNYSGMKVVFAEGLQKRSQKLIKDYLGRLVGNANLTLGATKVGETMKGAPRLILTSIEKYGTYIFMGILLLFWMVLSRSFFKEVEREGYLLEQFRRMNHVSSKISFSALGVLMLISLSALLIGFDIGGLFFAVITIMFLWTALIQVKKFQWSN